MFLAILPFLMHLTGISRNSPSVVYDSTFSITSLSLWEFDLETGFDGLKTWYFQAEDGSDLSQEILKDISVGKVSFGHTINTNLSSYILSKTMDSFVGLRQISQQMIDQKHGILRVEKMIIQTQRNVQPLIFMILEQPLLLTKKHPNLVGYEIDEMVLRDSLTYKYDNIVGIFCEKSNLIDLNKLTVEFNKPERKLLELKEQRRKKTIENLNRMNYRENVVKPGETLRLR
jgi:hypothetical protein